MAKGKIIFIENISC